MVHIQMCASKQNVCKLKKRIRDSRVALDSNIYGRGYIFLLRHLERSCSYYVHGFKLF